jgi:hypothetical protein
VTGGVFWTGGTTGVGATGVTAGIEEEEEEGFCERSMHFAEVCRRFTVTSEEFAINEGTEATRAATARAATARRWRA